LLSKDFTQNRKAFTILIQNEIFRFVRALAANDYETAFSLIEEGKRTEESPAWSIAKLEAALKGYYETGHSKICIDQKARSPKNTLIQTDLEEGYWHVQQILIDPEENNDWAITFKISIEHSREILKPSIELIQIQSL
jgi:hypothetical protein